jgi:hypothetical protein
MRKAEYVERQRFARNGCLERFGSPVGFFGLRPFPPTCRELVGMTKNTNQSQRNNADTKAMTTIIPTKSD